MLNWTSPEVVRGPSREYRVLAGGREYVIKGPLTRSILATRTVEEFYAVSCSKLGPGHSVQVASQHLGEAPTLQDAKALAEHHHLTPTPEQKEAAREAAKTSAGILSRGLLFRDRGFSKRTIEVLTARGIDAPGRLLFAPEAKLKNDPRNRKDVAKRNHAVSRSVYPGALSAVRPTAAEPHIGEIAGAGVHARVSDIRDSIAAVEPSAARPLRGGGKAERLGQHVEAFPK